MKLNNLAVILIAVILASCDQGSTSVDKQKFEAFLQTKRIPLDDEVRYKRMLAEYERRTALSDAIYDTDVLDKLVIDSEVEEFRKQLLISRYFEKYLSQAVTDQGIQNYYSEHADNYKTRKAKVSHILFRVNPRMDDIERQAMLTKATEAHSRINSGEDFTDVAKAVSEDRVSAEKGGDLGWINDGAISKSFTEKVFAMSAGEISEPFLSDYGFHIVKLVEEPQDIVKPLETLKGDIRYQLRSESKKAEMKRLLASVGYEPKSKQNKTK